MVLEIINSTLSHSLHTNPHLVYSLLYQREIFEPYRAHPSLMHLIQNIETVSSQVYLWSVLIVAKLKPKNAKNVQTTM